MVCQHTELMDELVLQIYPVTALFALALCYRQQLGDREMDFLEGFSEIKDTFVLYVMTPLPDPLISVTSSCVIVS